MIVIFEICSRRDKLPSAGVSAERKLSAMRKWGTLFLSLILFLAPCAQAEPPIPTEGIVIPVMNELKSFDLPENEAMATVRSMKAGWNLGNTFDSFADYGDGRSAGDGMETYWNNPRTTPELMASLREAGFNTLRLPVSWHNHVDEHYVINPDWLNRVIEVADYALSLDMYVIVNVHHDNHENPSAFFYPDEAHFEQSAAYLQAIWTQLAAAFADRDEHLILESMNEPRLVGSSYEWSWNAASKECKESADCINRLNQLFVDTVRASGGRNATRYLMVPAYCAAPWNAVNTLFRLPEDPAENRLIVSAHAYTPYPFALEPGKGDSVFSMDDTAKKSEIAVFLNELYRRFVAKGIPVVMDEFGAVERNGNLQDRVNFTAWYVACASIRGITCCWWDNGIFSGEGERFGLINRRTLQWVYPDIPLTIDQNSLINR